MRLVKVIAVSGIPLMRRSLFDALTDTNAVENCEHAIYKSLEAKIPTATLPPPDERLRLDRPLCQ
jgi:hypothetical protein